MQTPTSNHHPAGDLESLVRAARAGDNAAWARLVDRLDGRLRRVARSYRLSPADVDDVAQLAWVRLYEHIDRINDPSAVAGWLVTTVRREAMRVLQSRVRETLVDGCEYMAFDTPDGSHGQLPEDRLIAAETRLELGRALASLPGQQRALLTLLAGTPDASYREISTKLRIPVGSIGPTRARGMERLERHPELSHLRSSVA